MFTPKGDAITLPAGATPVDMAYALRTELGHHCIGARVNGQLVPLASVVADEDVVEVLTSTAEYRAVEWLGFVKSPQAASRSPVARWRRRRRRGRPGGDRPGPGRAGLVAPAGHLEDGSLVAMLDLDLEAMYRAVGQGSSAQSVAQWLVTVLGTQPGGDAKP